MYVTFYREFNQTNNKTDIGIKSAAGLHPKVLKQTDIVPDPRCMYFIFLISPKYGDNNVFLYDVLSQFPYPDITNVFISSPVHNIHKFGWYCYNLGVRDRIIDCLYVYLLYFLCATLTRSKSNYHTITPRRPLRFF